MILLLTWPWSNFIIIAMEPNQSNLCDSSEKSLSVQITDEDKPFAPIGDKFKQLLVTFLLASTLSIVRAKNSEFDTAASSPSHKIRSGIRPQIPPVKGIITQNFHAGHIGIDTAVPVGTPVYATMDGTVFHAGWNNEGYGKLVIIHNGKYKLYFAHLSEISVDVGDRVRTGMPIGLSGSTGNSTGPHLHYEVRINDDPVNPGIFNGKP